MANSGWIEIAIACCIFWGAMPAMGSEKALSEEGTRQAVVSTAVKTNASEAPTVNGLQIFFSTDKSVYARGEEIHIKVAFSNRSTRMFRVFAPSMFLGDELVIQNAAGQRIPWEGGFVSFSPKMGHYIGTTQIIQPGDCFERTLAAWIDPNYRLVFGDHERSAPLDAEARRRLGVPDEYPDQYIATGRIFALQKPGCYRLSFCYAKADLDRNWRIDPDPIKNQELLCDIWIGRIDSNPVVIEVR